MARRWIVVGVMLALGVGYVLHAVAFRPAPDDESVGVVRTWGELRARPMHELPNGERVWIGLESATVPRHGATMLYVLFESPAAGTGGPGLVRMDRNDGNPVDFVSTRVDRPWLRLFGTSVHVGEEPVTFSVFDRNGSELGDARLAIDATDSPWRPFDNPTDMSSRHRPAVVGVSLRAMHEVPAAPTWTTRELAAREGGDIPPRDTPLPRLVPDAQDPWIQLESTDTGILLRHPDGVRDSPTDRLLARFEVNGEVAPRPPPFLPPHRRVEARMDWRFTDIGALPGDRVSVEVLWCGEGWWGPGAMARVRRAWNHRGTSVTARRSNRVTFTVP